MGPYMGPYLDHIWTIYRPWIQGNTGYRQHRYNIDFIDTTQVVYSCFLYLQNVIDLYLSIVSIGSIEQRWKTVHRHAQPDLPLYMLLLQSVGSWSEQRRPYGFFHAFARRMVQGLIVKTGSFALCSASLKARLRPNQLRNQRINSFQSRRGGGFVSAELLRDCGVHPWRAVKVLDLGYVG